jgi:CubicO group peptidase (beta-lactamase class C family)
MILVACGASDAPQGTADAAPTAPATDAGDPPDATPSVVYPNPDWPLATPEDAGFDPVGLASAEAYAASIGSSCLAVVQDGRLIFERHWDASTPTRVHKTWSIAKSFTSTLLGIAIDRGEIAGMDQRASDFVSEWRGTDKETITIGDLASMSSGLEFDLVTDNLYAAFVEEQTQTAIDLAPTSPPGTTWHYSNRAVQVLHRVLEVATGVEPEAYARQHLWAPIGMNIDRDSEQYTHWERDGAGDATMYMSVHASCQDLARLGYLYLHRGRWQDQQVVSPAYVTAATSPSQQLNPVYGYLWWVNGAEPAEGSTQQMFDGTMMPLAPDDLFSAQGLGQTFIDVVPSTHTVYVHIRPAPHDPFTRYITDPQGTMDALFRDGLRIEHKELMRHLLAASGR